MDDASITYHLGVNAVTVQNVFNTLQKNRIIERIWAKDYTVWQTTPDNIINRLGWLNAPADSLKQLSYIHSVLDPVINEGCKNVVLLGMGGSSLAAEVFSNIFGSHKGNPDLSILDTTDPLTISQISQSLNWQETLFVVSSKSGTTLETISLFHYFYNLALKKLGKRACRNFIFITDPDSPMEELAYRLSLRHVFLNDPAIGGRYSALSFPGMVPAALLGIDVERLLQNALTTAKNEATENFAGGLNSSGSALGAVLGSLAQMGRNKLTFIFPPSLASFGSWLEQLVAESTGKDSKGILPVLAEPLKEPAAYNYDRIFIILRTKEKPISSRVAALIAAGHPVITVQINNHYDLGGQMFIWEMATAVASHIMGVNPFDQPDVEATKVLTRRMIDLYREKGELPQEEAALTTAEYSIYGYIMASTPAEALANFLDGATSNAYICFQVYLSPTPEMNAALRQLCKAISKKYRLAVTIGYGPRYLHSTGQLHKGDAGQGLFIQLTAADPLALEIPDRQGPGDTMLTFSILKSAQAMADRQALIKLGRKVIRIHLGKNIIANMQAFADYLQEN
jgi:glucose-6-phosphate isomerase